jgi:2',3'-cyclic-nucleotide 2'-phosphodiesterase (5'-nucleotidase family)
MKKITFCLLVLAFSTLPIHAEDNIRFTVFHTNDLHSHFDGIKAPTNNGYEKRGGFARITTLINQLREQKKNEILIGVDAGDFFAGTIFSAIAVSKDPAFPEYQFFIENKYDLLTLGNHEFDPLNDGLEVMLKKAESNPAQIPIVASNLYVSPSSPLKKFIGEHSLIRPYLIKEFTSPQGKIRVGFLGVLGPDGCLVSRSTRGDVHFIGFNDDKSKESISDLADHLNKMIYELRQKKDVDLIILTMHGGGSESYKLAEKLRGLDILIAGHTHKAEFAIVNGVIINQTGSYGENLGLLEFKYNTKTKRAQLINANKTPLIVIHDSIQEEGSWKKRIDIWRRRSFELMGQTESPNEVIFTPKKDYIRSSAVGNSMGELVTHAIITEINSGLKSGEDKVDAYFTSMGLIRTSFFKNTPYTRAEIFEATSIGFDKDKRPGIEVVSFYLTPKEVKLIISFMEVYTFVSTSFSPAISPNLSFKIRRWGIPFINRIHDIKLNGVPIDDVNRLIKIGTNRYVLANIETVKKITHGWIDLAPKTKKGELVTTYQTHPKEYQLISEHFRKNPKSY